MSRTQFEVCITVADVQYEIQSLYIGLAVKALSVLSIGKSSGSDSETVAS